MRLIKYVACTISLVSLIALGYSTNPYFDFEKLPSCIELNGYFKTDSAFDTRQIYADREGDFLFYPQERLPDIFDRDINHRGQFNMWSIENKLWLTVHGPDIRNAKTHIFLETDFFGRQFFNETILLLRMRHGYFKIDGKYVSFLAGQTWDPLITPGEEIDTISYDNGVPFVPYARDPQFRVIFHVPQVEALVAMMGGNEVRSFGPNPVLTAPEIRDTLYFRNAMTPKFHVQVKVPNNPDAFVGAGVNTTRLVPRIKTDRNIKVVESVFNVSWTIFAKGYWNKLGATAKLSLLQDAAPHLIHGGYAVTSIDPITDKRTYTPINTLAVYTDIYYDAPIQPGLFLGYSKNLGANKTIIPCTVIDNQDVLLVYGFFVNIDYAWRVSPRFKWHINQLEAGVELEITRASFGDISNTGKVINGVPVTNYRFIMSCSYFF
ncbi:hypothetical protein Noda2021_01180 [Candidatus Dependentiae bacterium Noda2021]|nr:hypothetical protein Noda2021_01180 [Candidatus Dependentiae bacterium Noda2021]